MCCKGIKPFIERQLPVPGYLHCIACNPGGEKTSLIGNNQRGIVPVNLFKLFCYPCSDFNRLRLLFRYNRSYIAILLEKLDCNPPERIRKFNIFKKYRQLVNPLFYLLSVFIDFPDRFSWFQVNCPVNYLCQARSA